MSVLNAAQRQQMASLQHAGTSGGTLIRPKRSKGTGVKLRVGAPGDELNGTPNSRGTARMRAATARGWCPRQRPHHSHVDLILPSQERCTTRTRMAARRWVATLAPPLHRDTCHGAEAPTVVTSLLAHHACFRSSRARWLPNLPRFPFAAGGLCRRHRRRRRAVVARGARGAARSERRRQDCPRRRPHGGRLHAQRRLKAQPRPLRVRRPHRGHRRPGRLPPRPRQLPRIQVARDAGGRT